MSAFTGAVGVVIALVAEDVIVGSAGGPSAVSGALKGVANVISKISDPNVAAIPNLAAKKG